MPVAAAIGAIGSLIGNFYGSYHNERMVEQTNANNRELIGRQNQLNIEQWQRENAYNHPVDQMLRLRAAGINPGIMYGSGGVMNSSAPSPAMQSSRDVPPQFAFQIDPLTAANIEKTKAETQSIKDANARENEKQPVTLENLQSQTNMLVQSIDNLREELDGIKSDNRKKAVDAYIAEETRDAAVQAIVDNAKLTHDQAEYYVLNLLSEIGLRESEEDLNRARALLSDKEREKIDEDIKIAKAYLALEREYLKIDKEYLSFDRDVHNAEKPWLRTNAHNRASLLSSNAAIRYKEKELVKRFGNAEEGLKLLNLLVSTGHESIEAFLDVRGGKRARGTRTTTRSGNKTITTYE